MSGLRITASSGTFAISKELFLGSLCDDKGTAEGVGPSTTISDKSFKQLVFWHLVYRRHDPKMRLSEDNQDLNFFFPP